MRVHHLVALENVAGDGSILDPVDVRHGALRGGRVAALAAPVDPLTHLNRDFPEHQANVCVVVGRLAVDAPVLFEGDGFRLAWVRPSSFARRGSVEVGARQERFHRNFEAARTAEEHLGEILEGELAFGARRGSRRRAAASSPRPERHSPTLLQDAPSGGE